MKLFPRIFAPSVSIDVVRAAQAKLEAERRELSKARRAFVDDLARQVIDDLRPRKPEQKT